MFNREEDMAKIEDQPEAVVAVAEDAAAPVEVIEAAPATIEEVVAVEKPVERSAARIPSDSKKYPGNATLRSGQKNESVRKVQKELSSRGFAVNTNGIYDRATENAVAKFCKTKGLTVDGTMVGPRTWNHLFG
jgi:peptidoglycan hydrolase-like protein with peptidoglycan-binding domain